MKKYLKLISIILGVILLVGCGNEKSFEYKIKDASSLNSQIIEFTNNWEYPLLKVSVSFEDGIEETYNLYNDLSVTATNYMDFTAFMNLKVKYDKSTIKSATFSIPSNSNLSETTYDYIKKLITETLLSIFDLAEEKDVEKILKSINFTDYDEVIESKDIEKESITINNDENIRLEFTHENETYTLNFINN